MFKYVSALLMVFGISCFGMEDQPGNPNRKIIVNLIKSGSSDKRSDEVGFSIPDRLKRRDIMSFLFVTSERDPYALVKATDKALTFAMLDKRKSQDFEALVEMSSPYQRGIVLSKVVLANRYPYRHFSLDYRKELVRVLARRKIEGIPNLYFDIKPSHPLNRIILDMANDPKNQKLETDAEFEKRFSLHQDVIARSEQHLYRAEQENRDPRLEEIFFIDQGSDPKRPYSGPEHQKRWNEQKEKIRQEQRELKLQPQKQALQEFLTNGK